MAINTYVLNDYGLVLSNDETEEYFRELYKKTPNLSTKDTTDWDLWSFLEDGHSDLIYQTEFIGYANGINERGYDNADDDYIKYDYEDYILYFCTENFPSLFKGAYKDKQEIIEEFRKKYGEYLPNDFDYGSHIRHIVGTYTG